MYMKKFLAILISVFSLSLSGCSPTEETKYGFCDTVTVGNFSFTLNNASNTKQVGSKYLGDTTNDNFVITNVTVKNIGNSEENLLTSMMLLHMGDSVYEPHSSGIYLDDGFYVLESIGAGITRNINVLYETPTEFTPETYLEVKASSYSVDSQKIYLTGTPYSPHIHTYSEEWVSDESGHWQVCTGCGALSEKVDHAYKIQTLDPTFEREGVMNYTCSVCGFSYSEKFGTKLEHNYSSVWSHDDTKHWHACIDGGFENLKKDEEEHSMTVQVVNPSFEERGYTLHSCSKCDYSFKDTYVDKLEHNYSDVWTYDESGHWHVCTDQGYSYLKSNVNSHDFSTWRTVTEATDTTDGLEQRDCNTCDYYETRVIDSNLTKSLRSLYIKPIDNNTCKVSGFNSSTLERVIIPDEVDGSKITSIDSKAFSNATKIKSISIGNNVTFIGDSAFQNCTSLTDVSFGTGLIEIYNKAFTGCTSLQHLEFNGEALNNVYANSFEGCDNIQYNVIDGGCYLGNANNPYLYFVKPSDSSGETLKIKDGCRYLVRDLVKGNNTVTTLEIPNSVMKIGVGTLRSFTSLTSLTIPFIGTTESDKALLGYVFGNENSEGLVEVSQNYRYENEIRSGKYYLPANLSKVVVTDGQPTMGAFSGCGMIKEIVFEKEVESCPEYLCNGCTSLRTIVLNGNFTSIGTKAFNNCSSLTTFVIPDSVTTIGDDAFQYCGKLCQVTVGQNVENIGGYAFNGCLSLFEIINRSSLVFLKEASNYGMVAAHAKYITNDPSKTKIATDSNGFVTFTDSSSKWLIDCENDTNEIEMPNDITHISKNCFSGTKNIKKIHVSSSLVRAEISAFPNTLEVLYWDSDDTEQSGTTDYGYVSSLTGCTKLKEVIIGENVHTLGTGVFAAGSYSPGNKVNALVLPKSVTTIKAGAFYGWSSLNAIFYCGTAEEYSLISIAGSNGSINNATKYYYSEEEPTSEGNYWHYVNGVATIWYL